MADTRFTLTTLTLASQKALPTIIPADLVYIFKELPRIISQEIWKYDKARSYCSSITPFSLDKFSTLDKFSKISEKNLYTLVSEIQNEFDYYKTSKIVGEDARIKLVEAIAKTIGLEVIDFIRSRKSKSSDHQDFFKELIALKKGRSLASQVFLSYLDMNDKVVLARTQKCLSSFFKPDLDFKRQLESLLQAVFHGRQEQAKRLIIANPRLLFYSGAIYNPYASIHSKNKRIEGTALQIAYRGANVPISNMIKDILKTMPKGELAIEKQHAEWQEFVNKERQEQHELEEAIRQAAIERESLRNRMRYAQPVSFRSPDYSRGIRARRMSRGGW